MHGEGTDEVGERLHLVRAGRKSGGHDLKSLK